MIDRPWWALALQFVTGGLVMTAAMSWLSRTRLQPTERERALEHPLSVLVLGAGAGMFFATIAVLSIIFPGTDPSPAPTLLFVGFVAMSVFVIVDYFRGRHVVEQEGLRYGKMLGQGGFAPWAEVRSVRYVESMRWFLLELNDGRTVRVSAMLRGLPLFAQSVLDRAPPDALDTATREVLDAATASELPSVWGS